MRKAPMIDLLLILCILERLSEGKDQQKCYHNICTQLLNTICFVIFKIIHINKNLMN